MEKLRLSRRDEHLIKTVLTALTGAILLLNTVIYLAVEFGGEING